MNTSTRFLINLTLAVLCITSIVYAQHPYTLQFFTSSDCSEESRIAYYYMPDTARPCQNVGCFEIVAGSAYGTENCTARDATPKDGWAVAVYSLVDTCETTQIEYGAQPDTCFVASGIPTNPYSYKLSSCINDTIFLGNYPDTTCTSKPTLIAVNTTATCTSVSGGYYKYLSCPALPVPVAEPIGQTPQSAPGAGSPVASPTKKSSTGVNLKLDHVSAVGSLILIAQLFLA